MGVKGIDKGLRLCTYALMNEKPKYRPLNLYVPPGMREDVDELQRVLRFQGSSLSSELRPEIERLVKKYQTAKPGRIQKH